MFPILQTDHLPLSKLILVYMFSALQELHIFVEFSAKTTLFIAFTLEIQLSRNLKERMITSPDSTKISEFSIRN